MNPPEMTRSYAGYLRLADLLDAQHPVTSQHDEMLFIVYHQITELWFKLLLHELDHARQSLCADQPERVRDALCRARLIVHQLNSQWTVLTTLRPEQFAVFRQSLHGASGLDSVQYRALEFLLGRRDHRWSGALRDFPGNPDPDTLTNRPSLFDEYLRYLHRAGHPLPAELVARDWRQPRPHLPQCLRPCPQTSRLNAALTAELAGLDNELWVWRRTHLEAVTRMIGEQPGTGGTTGVSYLYSTVDHRYFPELVHACT